MNENIFLQILIISFCLSIDVSIVCMINAIRHKTITYKYIFSCSIVFAILQAILFLVGYFIGYILYNYIKYLLPFLSFFVLLFLGINTIIDGIKDKNKEFATNSFFQILLQGLISSLDATTIGLSLSNISKQQIYICSISIILVTFFMSLIGFFVGKKYGKIYKKNTQIYAGILCILISIEIFLLHFI